MATVAVGRALPASRKARLPGGATSPMVPETNNSLTLAASGVGCFIVPFFLDC